MVGAVVSGVTVTAAEMAALLKRLLTTNDTLVSLMLNGPTVADKAVAFGASALPWNHWNL